MRLAREIVSWDRYVPHLQFTAIPVYSAWRLFINHLFKMIFFSCLFRKKDRGFFHIVAFFLILETEKKSRPLLWSIILNESVVYHQLGNSDNQLILYRDVLAMNKFKDHFYEWWKKRMDIVTLWILSIFVLLFSALFANKFYTAKFLFDFFLDIKDDTIFFSLLVLLHKNFLLNIFLWHKFIENSTK